MSIHSIGPCDHEPDEQPRVNPQPYPWGDLDPHDVQPVVEVLSGRGMPAVVFMPSFPSPGGGDDGGGQNEEQRRRLARDDPLADFFAHAGERPRLFGRREFFADPVGRTDDFTNHGGD